MELLPVTIGDMNCVMDSNVRRLFGAERLQKLAEWFSNSKPNLMFQSWGTIRVLSALKTEELVLVSGGNWNVIFRIRANEIHYFNCFLGLLTGWKINPDGKSVTGEILEFCVTDQGEGTYVPRTYLYNLASGEKIKI